jgi:hypothetical protein
LGYWGSFWSTQNQTAASTTTAYVVTLNNTDPDSNGVSVVSNSRVTHAFAGVYNLQFSVQFLNNANQDANTNVWFRKNGTDITDSSSQVTVPGQHGGGSGQIILALNYMLTLAANDYIELVWQTENTNVSLEYLAAGTTPTTPRTPSVIFTSQQVMYTQVGPTGPSGVIAVTSPITNSGTSTSAQLGFDQAAQDTTNDARYARLAGATFTGDILGGSTFSAFNTTNNLTIGKSTGYTNITATNNILSGGTIQSPGGSDITITDNYSVRDVYAPSGNSSQIINIGTGNTSEIPEAEAFINVNIGTGTGTARSIIIGSTGSFTQINGSLSLPGSISTGNIDATSLYLSGNLTVNGTTTTIDSATLTVNDKNIELGSVLSDSKYGIISSTATTTTMTGTNTNGIIPGMALTKSSGTGAFGGVTTVTSVDSATQFTFTSASANTAGELVFNVIGPSNTSANGGGITLKGTTDKTFNWLNATSAWTSSEHISLASGKNLLLNGSTSGTITLTPAATAGTNTITLPAATGTVALTSILKYQADEPTSPAQGDIWIESDVDVPTDTYATLTSIQTLTNKTLTSPKINENVLLTTTSTELNYVSGVTSSIQTQLNDKVNISNPTFQGTVSLGQSATFFIEGSTNDSFETTLTVADPTADRTITLPNATGTVALLDSPDFTGTPTVPTASVGTNTTQIATTAFVQANSARLVAERITGTAAIANTETVVLSFTAPSNSISAGDVFRFTGFATRAGANSTAPTFRIRIGPTTLSGAIVSTLSPTATATVAPFKFEAIVTCRSVGSSGTIGGAASALYSTGVGGNSITAPVTVNTTVSNLVEATIISGISGNSYTFEHAILEKLPT